MCDDNLEDGLSLPQETDDCDATRLMLQHCEMPAYQFVIQVAPDQTMVTTTVFFTQWGAPDYQAICY